MKFKTKDDLIKNAYYGCARTTPEKDSIVDGIKLTFKSFAKRVEFYKKYTKYGTEFFRLRDDNPELYSLYLKYNHKHNWTNGSSRVHDMYFYMMWLFDYCFSDVVE